MDSSADLLAIVALLIIGGKLAGRAGQRFGLPTAVGKITLGLLIGPAVLGIIHHEGPVVDLAEIGVIILMFLAGLETDVETMRKVTFPAFAVAIGGVILPYIGGLAIGVAFGLGTAETLFLGAILTATSVSISAQTLRELGRLQSREGTTILAAAVIDDILGIIVLAFVFAAADGGDPIISIGKMALFLPIAFILGQKLLAPVARRTMPHLPDEAQLAMLLGVALAYGWAAEHLGGVAAVTGAYMAGLIAAQTSVGEKAVHGLNWVGYSIFVPIFFVAIGLQADFASLGEAPLLVLAILAVAVAAKVVGCYLGARLTGFNSQEGMSVGIGMMSRGEVALVIAAAGLEAGVVEGSLFSATIVMTLVTTVLTPIGLKFLYSRANAESAAAGAPVSLPEVAPSYQ